MQRGKASHGWLDYAITGGVLRGPTAGTIHGLTNEQGLQRCPAREDGVGRQQEVERDPWTRRGEAAHHLGQAGNRSALPDTSRTRVRQ